MSLNKCVGQEEIIGEFDTPTQCDFEQKFLDRDEKENFQSSDLKENSSCNVISSGKEVRKLNLDEKLIQDKDSTFDAEFTSVIQASDRIVHDLNFEDVLKDDSGESLSPVVNLTRSPSEQTDTAKILFKTNEMEYLE